VCNSEHSPQNCERTIRTSNPYILSTCLGELFNQCFVNCIESPVRKLLELEDLSSLLLIELNRAWLRGRTSKDNLEKPL